MRTIQSEINEMSEADYANWLTDPACEGYNMWYAVCRYCDKWVNVAE